MSKDKPADWHKMTLDARIAHLLGLDFDEHAANFDSEKARIDDLCERVEEAIEIRDARDIDDIIDLADSLLAALDIRVTFAEWPRWDAACAVVRRWSEDERAAAEDFADGYGEQPECLAAFKAALGVEVER